MRQSQLAKMIYLIRRRDGVSRDELVMHWFKNHMPAVINSNLSATRTGRGGAARYIAQLFASQGSDRPVWDGMAQLWFAEPHPPMKAPAGDPPTDTFQEKCEPYRNWALKEFVVRGGEERLSTDPLTLNDPYPATRSEFFRLNYLVSVKPDTDLDEFYSHWLNVHIPNVDSHLDRAGGFRYIVNHSYFPDAAPYSGMAELYFENEEGARDFQTSIKPDGMERWVDGSAMHVMHGDTEMVGIP